VTETHYLDFKAFNESGSVSGPTVARSIAGLAVDGGILVLGVGENKQERRYELQPRSLVGLPEAVDQIVANRITPGLRVTIRRLERPDDKGYLVVLVPASARSPHMVDGRYYGRGDNTSRQLPDVEVRSLWLRHLDRRTSLLDLLAAEVARDPIAPELRASAHLFVVAQPVSADPRLLLESSPGRDLLAFLRSERMRPLIQQQRPYVPSLTSASTHHRRAHGIAISSDEVRPDRTVRVEQDPAKRAPKAVDLEVREDGGLRLFYSRASDTLPGGDQYLFMMAIVGEAAGVIEAARTVSEQAAFRGSWQFGVALRGIRSLVSYKLRHGVPEIGPRFSEDVYDEVVEVDRSELVAPGSPILELLLGRLLRASEGSSHDIATMDPFPVSA
jgi:hypothetical protein